MNDYRALISKTVLTSMARQAWSKVPLEQRKSVRKRIHPVVLSRINRLAKEAGQSSDTMVSPLAGSDSQSLGLLKRRDEMTLGMLSVVIPVYNVESYLDECLTSVINQSYHNLEIILVDDGSTDRSVEIAKGYERLDSRIKLIEKTNAGLGAARNTGVLAANGKYLAFADSDDIVPKFAYESMILSLKNSGSDFAVGSITRLKGKSRTIPRWAMEVHSENRYNLTVDEHPDILTNVFAWNKVFLKTFWDRHGLTFPEGIVYEDQEATARAYILADGFDVLSDVVYDWRIREDRTSITQQKDNIKDLQDRMLVITRLNDYMKINASNSVYTGWLGKVFDDDLPLYYSQIPRVGTEYWDLLQETVARLSRDIDFDFTSNLSVHNRVLHHLLVENSRIDFEKVICHLADYGDSFKTKVTPESILAYPSYWNTLSKKLPVSLRMINERKLRIQSSITSILEVDGQIKIQGYAYLQHIDSALTKDALVLSLVNTETGEVLPLEHKQLRSELIDRDSPDRWTSYALSGFSADLDTSKQIPTLARGGTSQHWALQVQLAVRGQTLTSKIRSRAQTQAAATLPVTPIIGEHRVICSFLPQYGLTFSIIEIKRIAVNAEVKGRDLTVRVILPSQEVPVHLLVENSKGRVVGVSKSVAKVGDEFEMTAQLPRLPKGASRTENHLWKVRIETQDKKRHHLAWSGGDRSLRLVSSDHDQLKVRTSGHGYMEIHERIASIVVDGCSIDESQSALIVQGRVNISDAVQSYHVLPRLVLANGRNVIYAKRVIAEDSQGEFSAVFGLRGSPWGGDIPAAEAGTYTLRALVTASDDIKGAYWVPVSLGMENSLPQDFSTKQLNIGLSRTPQAGALAVKLGPPLRETERGKFRQNQLQRTIPNFNKSGIKEGSVLFESFAGKTIADSGLGLFNEMLNRADDRPKFWTVRDSSVVAPTGATPVTMYSKDWYRILHSAEYVVNNNNFPYYYRKPKGQKYVQTWHGTPLKRIANDIPTNGLSLSYLKLMEREASQWDYLLAQNDFALEVLPKAFDYKGEMLNLGYPRNDALVSSGSLGQAARLRENLGISQEKKVILYAPTWRDNVKLANGQYDLVNNLDISVASKILGSDYVFLLRGHHNVSGQRYTTDIGNVIDVTSYPNINDLFSAADILVTDYSSVMFDYCVTGKPMYFLTPDLAQYRDTIRGFYFDFESQAPGPLVASTRELAEHISDAETGVRYADLYRKFKLNYAPRDDGKASSRVYDHIWNL